MKSVAKSVKMTSDRKSFPLKKSSLPDAPVSAVRKTGRGKDPTTGRTTRHPPDEQLRQFKHIFDISPVERIEVIRRRVPAKHIDSLAMRMAISSHMLTEALGLSHATISRKARENRSLSKYESELVIGIEYLIGQVEHAVQESGNPTGFDAAIWFSTWVLSRVPALGGETPAKFLDTIEGQRLLSNLLAMAQSGAYA